MKDTRNILLLVVSLCLVGTWAYHIYDKNNYIQEPITVIKKDSAVDQKAINDSLRRVYATALSKIDSGRTANDSVQSAYTGKQTETDSLRNEITAILNINTITKEDLRRAEDKIKQLQQKINSPRGQEQGIQSVNQTKTPELKNAAIVNDSKLKPDAKILPQNKPEVPAAYMNVTGINFRAIEADVKDQATTKASAAAYFAVSCQLQNSMTSFDETEVYLILSDPQGNVVQDDQWQAGMFLSRTNGRIPYSRKNSFSYEKGDTKRININIKPAEIMPGSYSIQIYHNGARIGKTDLRLY